MDGLPSAQSGEFPRGKSKSHRALAKPEYGMMLLDWLLPRGSGC
jgi:hypothetical protein